MPAPQATIEDRGYQRYAGARRGLGHSLWAIVVAALRRAMGIKRPFRTKILPWLLLLAAYAPVVVLTIVREISPTLDSSLLPSPRLYSDFDGLIALPLLLFAGLVAPDLLCPDRRERVLTLYFVAPITRVHYVAAKLGALFLLLLLMTVLPAILLFLAGLVLAGDPLGFVRDNVKDLPSIVLAGGVLALYFASVAVAVAAFNDRRHYASGSYVGILLVSSIASGILVNRMHFSHHERFAVLDLATLPLQVDRWIFAQQLHPNLSGWVYLGTTLAMIAVALFLTGWQYLRTSA
jgi:ABC-2 type transport system permease protein